MKIVYYSNIYFTDTDFSLIREYQRKGVDVYYIINIYKNHLSGGLLSFNSIPSYGFSKACDYKELLQFSDFLQLDKVLVLTRSNKWYSLVNLIISIKLLYFLFRQDFNIIHIGYELGLSECSLYLFWRKIIMTVHDPFSHSGEGSHYGEIKRKLAYRLIPRFILLNKNQYRDFIEYYHLEKKEILTNCFGSLNGYKYISDQKRNKHFLIEGDYVLFFGHFSPYKGIDVLCEAMKTVCKSMPELKCVIAGRGDLNFDVLKYKDSKQILFINRFIEVEELGELISSCLFVVCPYKDATQSGVVVTTYAYGKPILATNVGGMSESVIDRVTGRLIKPCAPENLAATIVEMANDKEQLALYSSNIDLVYLNGEKSWSVIAEKNIKFYEERIR